MATVIAIIPARYASTRLPGKPLVEIAGRPMIQHVYERTALAKRIDRVVVATDDERIRERVTEFGGEAMMTSIDHLSGTDRIGEAARNYLGSADPMNIVVNVQGDEPLVDPKMIDRLVEEINTRECDVTTPVVRITTSRELFDTNVVKVVMRGDFTPLYFSRSPIPCLRDLAAEEWLKMATFYKHIGIYAYRHTALERFIAAVPTPLEITEQLEQLRLLEIGQSMICVDTDYEGHAVDTPEDVMRVESLITASDGTTSADQNTTVGL